MLGNKIATVEVKAMKHTDVIMFLFTKGQKVSKVKTRVEILTPCLSSR